MLEGGENLMGGNDKQLTVCQHFCDEHVNDVIYNVPSTFAEIAFLPER